MREVYVHVHKAKQLLKKKDYYVVVSNHDVKKKTRTHKRTKDEASWEESLVLPFQSEHDQLKIILMDEDLITRDDEMGSGVLPLRDIVASGKPYNDWVEILNKKRERQGYLWLTVSVTGGTAPPPAPRPLAPTPAPVPAPSPIAPAAPAVVPPGTMKVTVREARHVCENVVIGNRPIDTVVRLRVNGAQIGETTPARNSTQPVWNQDFRFSSKPGKLELSVWEVAGGQFLGSVEVNIHDLVTSGHLDQWFFLKGHQGEDTGLLLLSFDSGAAASQQGLHNNNYGYNNVNNNPNNNAINYDPNYIKRGQDFSLPAKPSFPGAGLLPFDSKLPTERMRVVVVEGTGFRRSNVNGESDLYVVLRAPGIFKRTSTRPNQQRPIWNEAFEFNLKKSNDIEVLVYDEGFSNRYDRDDFLASTTIALSQHTGLFGEQWISLSDAQGRRAGSLLLAFYDIRAPSGGAASPVSGVGSFSFDDEYGFGEGRFNDGHGGYPAKPNQRIVDEFPQGGRGRNGGAQGGAGESYYGQGGRGGQGGQQGGYRQSDDEYNGQGAQSGRSGQSGGRWQSEEDRYYNQGGRGGQGGYRQSEEGYNDQNPQRGRGGQGRYPQPEEAGYYSQGEGRQQDYRRSDEGYNGQSGRDRQQGGYRRFEDGGYSGQGRQGGRGAPPSQLEERPFNGGRGRGAQGGYGQTQGFEREARRPQYGNEREFGSSIQDFKSNSQEFGRPGFINRTDSFGQYETRSGRASAPPEIGFLPRSATTPAQLFREGSFRQSGPIGGPRGRVIAEYVEDGSVPIDAARFGGFTKFQPRVTEYSAEEYERLRGSRVFANEVTTPVRALQYDGLEEDWVAPVIEKRAGFYEPELVQWDDGVEYIPAGPLAIEAAGPVYRRSF